MLDPVSLALPGAGDYNDANIGSGIDLIGVLNNLVRIASNLDSRNKVHRLAHAELCRLGPIFTQPMVM